MAYTQESKQDDLLVAMNTFRESQFCVVQIERQNF